MVSARVSAASRPASETGASPWRSPRKLVIAAVYATTIGPAYSTGGANGSTPSRLPDSTSAIRS